MPFKDPAKQKEAVRKAVAKTRGITQKDVIPENVIPKPAPDVIPELCQEKGCKPRTMHCAPRCYLLKWTVLPDPGEGWGGFAQS